MVAKKNIKKRPVGELCRCLFAGAIGIAYLLQLTNYIILFNHSSHSDKMYYWVEPYWYICIQSIIFIFGLLLVGIRFKNKNSRRVLFDIVLLIPLTISLILVYFHQIV